MATFSSPRRSRRPIGIWRTRIRARGLWNSKSVPSRRNSDRARNRARMSALKFSSNRKNILVVAEVGLTAQEQTSMLVCRGEVREFGLTGLTRNQVSLTAPGVRIPPSPPYSLACFHTFWRSDEISAGGAIHARRWTRRMPTATADGKNRSKFSVRDFGMSICEPADILRGSVLGKNAWRKQLRPRESIGVPELAAAHSRAGAVRFSGSLQWC